jgi:MoxR-like ATPase
MSTRETILDLKSRMSQDIVGQEHILERIIIGLLANGNLLVEGLPGLAKTRAIKSLGKHLEADLSRIQFTPDLLPSDVTGTEVYHQVDGKGEFRFEQGPIFANLVLADEVNRAPAKVQAALLEAMEERQVTVAGTTHKLPPLFLVMATQNPVEQEGTYPLPEAQMDRFLMHVNIEYPGKSDEVQVLRLVRGEETLLTPGGSPGKTREPGGSPATPGGSPGTIGPIPQDAVFEARQAIHQTHIAESIEQYIVDLIDGTRHPNKYSEDLDKWIDVGASPRGGIGLDKCSRAHAWLQGQDHVTPDNVRAVVHDVLRHRLMLSYQANASGISANTVIDELLKHVAVA